MTTFKNWRVGAVHLNPPNGNHISTTWAPYTYSDNHDEEPETHSVNYNRIEPPITSDTVEILIECSPKLLKKLTKKYNEGRGQPFGYVSFTDWLDIVNKVSNEIK